MALEAVAAVGLAGSVITLIDFAVKLISKGRQYHKSVDGSLKEVVDIKVVSDNLGRLSQDVIGSAQSLSLSGAPLHENEALQAVAKNCLEITSEFCAVLAKLEHQGPLSRWRSFRQAFKHLLGKKEIERMLQRLRLVREDLAIHLLVVMKQDLLGMHKQLEKNIVKHLNAIFDSKENRTAALSKTLVKVAEDEKSTVTRKWHMKNPNVVLGVSEALSNLALQDGKKCLTEFMQNSLFFPQLPERHARIAEAHTATFRWILDEDESCQSAEYSNYVQWLLDSSNVNGLYWVTGKPGSGKSTLMRYLYNDRRTKSYLDRWSHPQEVIFSSCFFWNSGDVLQKSLAGLLRSLLYELLTQRPEEIPLAMPWRCQMFEFGAAQTAPWTVSELLKALECVIDSMANRSKICFFVDGLDEFEGDEAALTEIIDLFCKIAEKEHVKVCLSSRPWLVFEDAFQSRPSLRLQDLTRNDIRNYVQIEVSHSNKFRKLQKKNFEQCANLINEIVDKAAGVFLWVHLVVRSLLQGLRNEDRIRDLQRRLDMIPADLTKYFEQMMTTLEPFYLKEAIELFDVALTNDHFLLTYSYIHEDDSALASTATIETTSEEEIEERLETTTRRINSRCKGLLEVYHINYGTTYFNSHVGFLHRTVKEFLLMKSTTKFMELYRDGSFDVNLALCRAFIAMMKGFDYTRYDHKTFEWALLGLFKYARDIEMQKGEALVTILDELYEVAAELYQRSHQPAVKHEQRWFPTSDATFRQSSYKSQFWMLIMAANLQLYVKTKLREHKVDLKSLGRPLLDCALRIGAYPYERVYNPTRAESGYLPIRPHHKTWMSTDLIDLLLVEGADPNEVWDGRTVWSHFLYKLHLLNRRRGLKDHESLWSIVRSLVRYGALGPFLHKAVQDDGSGNLNETEILVSLFGYEKLRELESLTTSTLSE
ncbi:MAG: hypothetical protein Q9195_002825 [Heterodermia aff. obscurata]